MALLVWSHLLGAALLIGGGAAGWTVARMAATAADPRELDRAGLALGFLVAAGLGLLLLSGTGLLVELGVPIAIKRGSVHAMLTGLLLAGGLHGAASARTRRLTEGSQPGSRGTIVTLRLALVVVGIAALAAGALARTSGW